jgi:hypothetical protein
MPLPRSIDIDGRRYLWRDLVALRQAQAQLRAAQPTLFELREDHRPPGERNAAERYCEPSLFTRAGAAGIARLSQLDLGFGNLATAGWRSSQE